MNIVVTGRNLGTALGALWQRVRPEFLTEFVMFAASTILLQISRMGANLVVARWLGPAMNGIWNSFALALTYAPLLTLGTINAMNRDVPLLAGQGKSEAARQVMQVTLFVSLLTGILSGLLVVILGMARRDSVAGRAVVFLGLLLVVQQVYVYLQTWLKCNIRFSAMSAQQLVFALLYPFVVLPTTALWGLDGFVLGQTIVVFGVSVWLVLTMRVPFVIRFDLILFFHLVKLGLPILAAGTLYGLLTTIDRWVILAYLGTEALGYYSLAIMTSSMLSLLPLVISQQMYTRMAYRFGETCDLNALRPIVLRQILFGSGVTIPVLGIVYFGLSWIVKLFLSEYVPGVEPARILLLGLACLPLAGGIGNFLNTVNKQTIYLCIQAVGVVLSFVLEVIFVKVGMGLRGVALGATLAMVVYALLLLVVGLTIFRKYGHMPQLRQKDT